MNYIILSISIILIRLVSLIHSKKNEKKLLLQGAEEFGKTNSLVLTLAHLFFYLSVFLEGYLKNIPFNKITLTGLVIYSLSMVVLIIVIKSLGSIWTVKLYIAPNHIVNKNKLFSLVRHPNYFLNILPELVGLSIAFQAWNTLYIGLPLYIIPLTIRIIQEEKIMKEKLPDFK